MDLIVFAAFIAATAYMTWRLFIKREVMPPCPQCKNHYEELGWHFCRRIVGKIDGEPELCCLARGRFNCKFERKAGE